MGRLGGVFAAFDDDDFRWWIARQAAAGDAAGVHRTLGHRDSAGRNAWFAARDDRNELAGYADDLELAWALAERAGDIGLQCRYALLRATLGDVGSRFRAGLAARLVGGGVWTREQALAWAGVNRDPQGSLASLSDALAEAEGTRRESLAALALATSARMVSTDDRTLMLAELARDAPPHERATLLDAIAAEQNEGARSGGLTALVPQLPTDLLDRAAAVARAFGAHELRARALVAVAARLPPDAAAGAYADALTAAREALVGPPVPGAHAGVRTVEALAASLPEAFVGELDALAAAADLGGYDMARVRGALLERRAIAEPSAAARESEALPTGPRDAVLAAAARAHARAGRSAAALEATGAIRVESSRAAVLHDLAMLAPDDPGLLDPIAALSPHHQVEMLRELAATSSGQAAALRDLAAALPDAGDRLRALAAIAPVLPPAELDALLTAILNGSSRDQAAVAQLAPHLSAEQARMALDALGSTDWRAATALAVRLAALGAGDEAVARLVGLADPSALNLPDAVATLARHLPDELLPAVRAAVQPASAANERVAARTALAAHLPEARVAELLAEVAALEHPVDRVRALAPLAAHPGVQRQLAGALRAACASRHLDRYAVALDAVRTVAAPARELVSEILALPPSGFQLLALLALAHDGECAGAAVALLLREPQLGELAAANPGDADDQLATTLAAAVLAVEDPRACSRLATDLAPLLGEAGRAAAARRAAAVDDGLVRLRALTALARASGPTLRAEIVASGRALHAGSDDPALLALGESRPSPSGVAASVAAERGDWAAVAGLAPWLDAADVNHVREQLAAWRNDAVQHAAAALAARAAALGEPALALACLRDAPERFGTRPAIVAAAPHLPAELLTDVAALAEDDGEARAALAVAAATAGDRESTFALLDGAGEEALADIAAHAPAEWAPTLLPAIRELRDGPRAEALATLIPRLAPNPELVEEAFRAADGHRYAAAPARRRILAGLAPNLARLAPERLLRLWSEAMRATAERSRHEVLVDVEALAAPLIAVFGAETALALDDAIRVGAGDRWP